MASKMGNCRVENDTGSNEDRAIVSADTKTSKRQLRIEDLGDDLLPGIPNDITLNQITSKMSWRDFHILSSVSRGWQQAIQNRLVYDGRVRSSSTETLGLMVYFKHSERSPEYFLTIELYSLKDDTRNELLKIPHISGGIRPGTECVSLDGKIYVLGGGEDIVNSAGSTTVYVLDLAGQRRWKQCASMREARVNFGAGVLDGKIYVFGGTSLGKFPCGAEVYDPKVNAWSDMKPMTSLRRHHRVLPVAGELFVHGGKVYDPTSLDRTEDGLVGEIEPLLDTKGALFVEAYHPLKDEWRTIAPFQTCRWDKTFTAKGKFYWMDSGGIYVYDFDEHSWKLVQSYSKTLDDCKLLLCTALVVDDTVLALAGVYKGNPREYCGPGVLRGRGFGNEKEQVVWEKLTLSHSYGKFRGFLSVQL